MIFIRKRQHKFEWFYLTKTIGSSEEMAYHQKKNLYSIKYLRRISNQTEEIRDAFNRNESLYMGGPKKLAEYEPLIIKYIHVCFLSILKIIITL